MSLPNITIPLELPIDIPLLVHPAVVHFVIAIPIVILLLEIINLGFKKRALSVFSLFLMIVVAVAMSAAYFTGAVDGKEAYSLLASEGQAELKEHKLLGIYLVYGSLAMVILKLLFMAFSKVVARLFFIVLLIGFIAVTLKQGKEGGELVYKYGANNQAVVDVEDKLEELQDEYDELEEESKKASTTSDGSEVEAKLKELQEKYDALLKSSEESSSQEPTKAKEEFVNIPETEVEEVAVEKTEEATTEEKEEPKTPFESTKTEEPKTEVEPKEEAQMASTSTVNLEIPSDTNESY